MLGTKFFFYLFLVLTVFSSCANRADKAVTSSGTNLSSGDKMSETKWELATFGGGCFWCTEAIFQRLKGVEKVVSGYSGGFVENPTYKQICEGNTGHAEVIQISFDPKRISYGEILEVFWKTHDPTTLNRQGNDVGPQYRSVVYFHNDSQKHAAEAGLKKISGMFDRPVVTEISPLGVFYPAEAYHQNYFNQNGGQSYCAFVIKPKVEKFEKSFKDKLK